MRKTGWGGKEVGGVRVEGGWKGVGKGRERRGRRRGGGEGGGEEKEGRGEGGRGEEGEKENLYYLLNCTSEL